MMRQLRENTKWIMLVTAAAFVGLMVFEWGMDLSGQSSAQLRGGEIGRVNGESITYEEFSVVYRNLYDQIQLQQAEPISGIQNRDIEKLAWDQLVAEKLIEQELRRQGLSATASEVRQAARFMPPPEFYQNELFYTDGQFDLAKYHEYLSSPAVDPQLLQQLELYYRQQIPRRKLAQRVMAGMYLTDGELWRLWRDMYERVSIRFVRFEPELLIPDAAIDVTDDELAAYYRQNRSEFERPKTAHVRMTVLSRAPSAEDTARVAQRAHELRAEILAGADFAEVARRESADPGSASQGGDLGTFGRGVMDPDFESAAFATPVGEISEPVLTPFGIHLIKVENREGDQVTARHILLPITSTDEATDALFVRADSLEMIGEREGLQAAADRFGLPTLTVQLVEEMPVGLPNVGRVDEGVDWALWEAAPGEVSPVFETPTAFYMLELIEVKPEGLMPFEEARPTIETLIRRQKKMEQARTLAQALVNDIRSGRTLTEAAEARQLLVEEVGPFSRMDFVPGVGYANAAIGAAFGLKPGQTSGVVEADEALFVIEVVSREEADRQAWEEQKLVQRLQLLATLEQDRWGQYVASLRERANIVDRRNEVLRATPDDLAQPLSRGLF